MITNLSDGRLTHAAAPARSQDDDLVGGSPPGQPPDHGLTVEPVTRRRLPRSRRRQLLTWGYLVAAVIACVLGRLATHRTRSLSPASGHVTVQIPISWTEQAPVLYPGGDSPADGVRSTQGLRSVAVAWSGRREDPQAVVGRIAPPGCRPAEPRAVRVGDRDGVVRHRSSCPDGTAVDEVALVDQDATPDGTGWTVWVEVRTKDGDPDLASVLSGIRITQLFADDRSYTVVEPTVVEVNVEVTHDWIALALP
jgi:hypothetical protein